MTKLEKALLSLNRIETSSLGSTTRSPRALTLVTIIYLIVLLSVPLTSISMVLLFGIYPIVMAGLTSGGYSKVLYRSLFILPFIILIGIFNPLLDRTPFFTLGEVKISRGWVTFTTIIFRGLWAVQAVIIMIGLTGFYGFCRGLRGLGVPKFLTIQLMMVYRYLIVLLEETLRMKRARESRGYGRKSMSLKMWSTMIGQLFVRTIDRSVSIHRAMLSRGFNGDVPLKDAEIRWHTSDTFFLIGWTLCFLLLRFISPARLFATLAS